MKRAFLGVILDLSLPLHADIGAARSLGRGVAAAMRVLERIPSHRVEVALAGGVTSELLRFGEERSLQLLAERAGAGQVTFLSTACYGAFLPLLPPAEAARQLDLNDALNREVLGDYVYRPQGLFPPQLGYSRRIAELAMRRGLPRVLADDLGYRAGVRPPPRDRHFTLQAALNFHVFFVDRGLSRLIAEGEIDEASTLREHLGSRFSSNYAIVRIPGRLLSEGGPALRLLASLDGRADVLPASLEELLALYPEVEMVEPLPSALGTDPAELASGVQFAKWSAPGNELQAILWRMAQIAATEAERTVKVGLATTEPEPLRSLLDESLDCAAWRFASGKPEFDPRQVLAGGRQLLAAVRAGARAPARAEVEDLFARLRRKCEEASQVQLEAVVPG